MAEETVVKDVLTKEMIQAGADLVRCLDEAHLEVRAALWLYMPEKNLWRLMIASPYVETKGPLKAYQKIRTVLSRMPEDALGIDLKDISAVEDSHPLIAMLRTVIHTKESISGIRFSKNTIRGHFIEDTYVYRMT